MAFCKNCGTDLKGASFCSNCGVGTEVAMQGGDARQNSLAEIQKLIEYFGMKQGSFDEFDKVYAEVEERSARSYIGLIIFSIICIFIGANGSGFLLGLGIVCLVVAIVLGKKNKKKLGIVQVRLSELETELTSYYNDYGYCPVGMEYVRPSVLRTLSDIVRNGRAITVGEAINVYISDVKQEEMLQLQREATASAKEAAKAAKRTASYSTASFWLKK